MNTSHEWGVQYQENSLCKEREDYYEIFKSYPFAPIPFSGMNNTYLIEEEQFVEFFLQMIYPKKERQKKRNPPGCYLKKK